MQEINVLLKSISQLQRKPQPVPQPLRQQSRQLQQLLLPLQRQEEGKKIKVERKRNKCFWTWHCRHHVALDEAVLVGLVVKILDPVSIHVIMKIHVKSSLSPHVPSKPSNPIQMDVIVKQEQIFNSCVVIFM